MAVEAAELFVTVTADTDKATRGLHGVNDSIGKTDGFLKGAAKQAVGFAGGLAALAAGGAVFGSIKSGVIDMNAELETSTLQFETLMGDSDKAKKHVESLFDFAARTPFETGPIIEASRIMETFGGKALNTKDNLTLFGDAAAATNAPINDIAFWMSRAYAAIQGGQPFGEARMRLMELGVITPKVANQMTKMEEAGASGADMWERFSGQLGKFSGAMEKQAGTWDGLMATLSDAVNMFLAKAGKPLFDALKGIVKGAIDLMSSPAFNGAMATASQVLGAGFALIGDALNVVSGYVGGFIDKVKPIIGLLDGAATATTGFVDGFKGVGKMLGTLGTQVQNAIFGAIESVFKQIPAFVDAFFQMASQAVDAFIAIAPELIDALLVMVGNALNWLLETGVPMAAEALSHFAQAFIAWVGPAAAKLAGALPGIAERIFNFLADAAPRIVEKLVEWGGAFVGWVAANVLPKLPGALADIARVLIGWIAQTAPVVVGRVVEMGGKLLGVLGDKLRQLPPLAAKFLGEVVANVARWAGQMVQQGVQAGARFLLSVATEMAKVPQRVMSFLGQLPGMVLSWGGRIASGALDAGRRFVNSFISALGKLPGLVADAVRNAFQSVRIDVGPFHISASGVRIDMPNIQLPSFATGAWNLPHDMVAQVHAGEMIVPRDIAERLRGGRGFGPGAAGDAAGGGGGTVVIVNIGDFHGTEDNIRSLSRQLGEVVRYSTLRKSSAS